jgi:hypothetical protein
MNRRKKIKGLRALSMTARMSSKAIAEMVLT